MKLRILSDIHKEFFNKCDFDAYCSIFSSDCVYDYIIIAGDLDTESHRSTLDDIYYLTETPIIFVPGNHDFWGGSFHTKNQVMLEQLDCEYVHYLNNDYYVDGKYMFIGTTLWWSDEQSKNLSLHYMRYMADLHKITELHLGKETGFDWGKQAYNFLVDALSIARARNLIPIVISHNAPSYKSINAKFSGSPMNMFFANNYDALIEEYQPKLWVHGHMHDSFKYKIKDTTIVCNPYGYHNREVNPEFKKNLIITV